MKHVLIVEDHQGAMERMQRIVSLAFGDIVVQCATTISSGRKLVQEQFFDLAVIDLALPDGNGEDFTLEISKQSPNTYIVISTIHDESSRLFSALENGARGFLLKEQSEEHLIQEFRGILHGKPPLAPAITRRLVELVKTRSSEVDATPLQSNATHSAKMSADVHSSAHLTDREQETLRMVANGFDRSEIAARLGISKNTVSSHISKIYSKLNIRNRAEATLVAREMELI